MPSKKKRPARKQLKQRAQETESKARFIAKKAYQKDRYSVHKPFEEIERLYSRAYGKFRIAGNTWRELGYQKRARECYQSAEKYKDKGKEARKSEIYRKKSKGLQNRLGFATLSIISISIALISISFNLTGYAIGGLNQNFTRLIGVLSFILGLIFAFFYVRKKK